MEPDTIRKPEASERFETYAWLYMRVSGPLLILMVGVLSPVLQDTEENPFPGFRTYVCPWQMAVSGLRLVVLMGKIPRLTVSLA